MNSIHLIRQQSQNNHGHRRPIAFVERQGLHYACKWHFCQNYAPIQLWPAYLLEALYPLPSLWSALVAIGNQMPSHSHHMIAVRWIPILHIQPYLYRHLFHDLHPMPHHLQRINWGYYRGSKKYFLAKQRVNVR